MKLKELMNYLNMIDDGNVEVEFLNGNGRQEIKSLSCSNNCQTLYLTGHNYSLHNENNDAMAIIETINRMINKERSKR